MIKRLAEYALILVLVPALSLVASAVLLGGALGAIGIGARYEIFALPLVMFGCAWVSGWFAAWKTGNIKMDAAIPKLLSAVFGALAFFIYTSPPPTHFGMGHEVQWSDALFAALAGHGKFHWSEGLTLLIAAVPGPFLGVRFRARQRAKQSGR